MRDRGAVAVFNRSRFTLVVPSHYSKLTRMCREGHPERFTALYGEEKREEGVRGDPNEMRWNQQRREWAIQ